MFVCFEIVCFCFTGYGVTPCNFFSAINIRTALINEMLDADKVPVLGIFWNIIFYNKNNSCSGALIAVLVC